MQCEGPTGLAAGAALATADAENEVRKLPVQNTAAAAGAATVVRRTGHFSMLV